MSEAEGRWLDYTVTFLEMTAAPEGPRPPAPGLAGLALIRSENPPGRWFLHLYDSVGAAYEWTDWHRRPAEELTAFLTDPAVELYTLMLKGWSAGFFMLDWRKPGECELVYFGLTPEAEGMGLGKWLLSEAIRTGWAKKAVRKMTVETCTLDGPRALPLYQKMGFSPVRREDRRRRASS